jgi:hypothetical protein
LIYDLAHKRAGATVCQSADLNNAALLLLHIAAHNRPAFRVVLTLGDREKQNDGQQGRGTENQRCEFDDHHRSSSVYDPSEFDLALAL